MALALTPAFSGCGTRTAAPRFSYSLLDGSRHESTGLLGQVVLVNFWATTCAICVAEMPEIVALHRRFERRGLSTLAVAMSYDPPARVSHFAETRALPLSVVIDNTGDIARAFGDVRVTPSFALIDRRSRLVRQWSGTPAWDRLARELEELLAEAG